MIKFLKKLKDERGFTLVEMAIVILIIAGLLLIIIPNIGGVTDSTSETTEDAIVNTVETQMVIYELDGLGDNPSAEELAADGYITPDQLTAYNEATAGN